MVGVVWCNRSNTTASQNSFTYVCPVQLAMGKTWTMDERSSAQGNIVIYLNKVTH